MSDRPSRPTVCVSLGDPAGIGPEVTARALAVASVPELADWLLIGSEKAFARALERCGIELEYSVFSGTLPDALEGGITLLDVGAGALPEPGAPDVSGGRWAGLAVTAAVEIALKGRAAALVTAPLAKTFLFAAGFNFPGHTEMLASLCGEKKPVMLMAADSLRVAVFTRHVALRAIFKYIKRTPITETIIILARELRRWFGISRPRIAVAALNPHGGEGGMFGTEDDEIVAPAVAKARSKGWDVSGPIPADTLFRERERLRYDAVLALYHDQGLAPFKALAGKRGVNVTLNLPFLRTSPDHGTAFDIAADFKADPSSMMSAMELAARCGARRWE